MISGQLSRRKDGQTDERVAEPYTDSLATAAFPGLLAQLKELHVLHHMILRATHEAVLPSAPLQVGGLGPRAKGLS